MKFTNNSKAVKDALKKANKAAMTKSCEVVVAQAKSLSLVKHSKLKDELSYKIEESPDGSITGTVGSPTHYAPFVEFGTGEYAEKGDGRKGGWSYEDEEGDWWHTYGQEAKPYLRPAFRLNKDNIEKFFGKELKTVGDK